MIFLYFIIYALIIFGLVKYYEKEFNKYYESKINQLIKDNERLSKELEKEKENTKRKLERYMYEDLFGYNAERDCDRVDKELKAYFNKILNDIAKENFSYGYTSSSFGKYEVDLYNIENYKKM